jgi:uncharacterized protein (TIGR00299 family) protein
MKTLYLDIFSGISGDMFLGAMIDLGVDFAALENELKKLQVDGYRLHSARKQKANIDGVKFDVELLLMPISNPAAGLSPAVHDHSHEHARDFAQIKELIQASDLSDWVKEKSIAVFHRVAVAEGKVHGMPPEDVHFHEVGAVDSIVDLIGACIALEMLGRPRVLSAPVVEGTGWVLCAHGRFPVPTAATLEILGARGVAVTQCEEQSELVTPTGAALLAEFAESFEGMQALIPDKIGYGLGTRNCKTRPNVLRACLGESNASDGAPALDWETDRIVVLETNLDDISSEVLGHFMESALAAGALDAFHTPIQMKKNRPGVLLSVLCAETDADRFTESILRETTAFGVRRTITERRKLKRETRTVETEHGPVEVKIGLLNGKAIQVAPEYESCRALAETAGVPLKVIQAAALKAVGQ